VAAEEGAAATEMNETTIAPTRRPNHSALVEMALTLDGGEILSVGQLGSSFVILDSLANLPPCEGEITLSVDGRERRWRVALPDGASEAVARTPITAL